MAPMTGCALIDSIVVGLFAVAGRYPGLLT